ncbi:asparagine synthase-related protein [Thermoactinospora rubra]|uniref:asparagine synthase-related protein n=1 Tax=Thermoactinospora rubra TaxID=1088767 RepID=UPI000A1056FC|nr:asparagine synthase-related protein [Thermoactinospora rubra]
MLSPAWFVVLPDHLHAHRAARALAVSAPKCIHHASGRPWILGDWDDTMTVGCAGFASVAVLGDHLLTRDRLEVVAARLRTAAELDAVMGTPPGSYHLFASVAGETRVQGTVSSLRPVFHGSVLGTTIAADRADVLARLAGSAPAPDRLAVQLLDPPVLFPLTEEPVWEGISAVPAGHYLLLDGTGQARAVRRWTPPKPVLPMDEGARWLREALTAAVEVRTHGRDLVSCDLAGADSTALCSLAIRGRARVAAYTAAYRDPLGDDVAWARRTVAALGGVEHHVIPAEEVPLVYDGIRHLDEPFDEPCATAADRNRWLTIVRAAARHGSRLHMGGFGGDELLYGSIAHLHGLLRRNPSLAVRHLRGFAAQYRWPYRQTLRMLAAAPTHGEWLRQVARELTAPAPPVDAPALGWGRPPRLPPWITPEAVDVVRDRIHAVADARPLAPGHGLHQELVGLRAVSRAVRQLGQMAAGLGVRMAAPYYDDAVIEAALAVRPGERISPWQYKPLIVEAMRGIVPDIALTRATKADGSHDVEMGLREHRADVLALWEDSRLGRLGLVDVAMLRELSRRPLPPVLPFSVLYQTIACELWLRSLEDVPLVAPRSAHETS